MMAAMNPQGPPVTDEQWKAQEQVAEQVLALQPPVCDDNDPKFTTPDAAFNWFKCGDRFKYSTAIAVLIAMIGGLSAGVIAILRKRDIQR